MLKGQAVRSASRFCALCWRCCKSLGAQRGCVQRSASQVLLGAELGAVAGGAQ